MKLLEIQKESHKIAKEKGFWDSDRDVPECLMLIVTELSECCEAYRKNNYNGMGEELADTIIRIGDLAEHLNINLEEEVIRKMEFNKTRPYKHGKRC